MFLLYRPFLYIGCFINLYLEKIALPIYNQLFTANEFHVIHENSHKGKICLNLLLDARWD